MCRIAYNPSPSTNFNKEDLLGFFQMLEKVAGKDGNGLYVFNTDTLEKHLKGMPSTDIKGAFIFHTRIGTSGNKKRYNNQPLVNDRYILAHNGSYYKMEDYATLLGYVNPNKKYSDSRMAHFIVNKVGILNFWLALKDSVAGVFLIHDKKIKQTFLLKFSGVFECSNFKNDEILIYASSDTDYWDVENTISLDNGFYRLHDKYYELLDEKRAYHSSYSRTPYNGNTYVWDEESGTAVPRTKKKKKQKKQKTKTVNDEDYLWEDYPYCYYCSKPFKATHKKYIDWGFTVCEPCFIEHGTGVETDIYGIEIIREDMVSIKTLFADIPKYCTDCKWLYGDACWFGGVEKVDFPEDMVKAICNTNNPNIGDIKLNCDECHKRMKLSDDWKMFRTAIICLDCIESIKILEDEEAVDSHFIDCNTCRYELLAMSAEPCRACFGESRRNGERPYYWEIKQKCSTCMFHERQLGSKACRLCQNFDNWTSIEELRGKCWDCGYHFDVNDEIIEDKNGHQICDACDNAFNGGLNSRQDIKDYQAYYYGGDK